MLQDATSKVSATAAAPFKTLSNAFGQRYTMMINSGDVANTSPRILWYLLVASICSFLIFSLPRSRVAGTFSAKPKEVPNPIYNSTLGFQKAFTIELPDRTDRLQILYDSANATGISLILRDGITDEEAEEDRPNNFPDNLRHGDLACAVTHIRAWKMITETGLLTTLLTEGDADWDPRLKDILAAFAAAAGPLTKHIPLNSPPPSQKPPASPLPPSSNNNPTISPYGDDWDLLWLGSCGVSGHTYIPYKDPAVPPRDREHELIGFKYGHAPFPDDARKRRQRLAVDVREGVCTQAYAVSLRGAHKLLRLVNKGMDTMVDHWLGLRCGDGGLKCVAPWPQIFDDAKSISSMDLAEGQERGEPTGAKGDSVLEYSIRVNAKAILEGEGMDQWVKNWA